MVLRPRKEAIPLCGAFPSGPVVAVKEDAAVDYAEPKGEERERGTHTPTEYLFSIKPKDK